MSCCDDFLVKRLGRGGGDQVGGSADKNLKKKLDQNDHEFSFNSIIPISLVTECGILIFSVASYLFTKERDLPPYSDTYLIHLEEVFIGIVGVVMALNVHWLWHYRSSGSPYTKIAKIVRAIEGLAIVTGAALLMFNAFKVNDDCHPPPEADPQCHKLEAKMAAVGMCLLDALLHIMRPVDSLIDNSVVVVTGDFSMIKTNKQPGQNGDTESSLVVVNEQPQTYRLNGDS